MRLRFPQCVRCNKRIYMNRVDAFRVIGRMLDQGDPFDMRLSTYLCRQGSGYHVGHDHLTIRKIAAGETFRPDVSG